MKKHLLILEDDSVYGSCGFGADHYQIGELVFSAGMSGYQEIPSDSSYRGQVTMTTYLMIGSYGTNRDDFENLDPVVFGFAVEEHYAQPGNFRCDLTLDKFLKLREVPEICHVDTRVIARKLRNSGTMHAIMTNADADVDAMVRLLKEIDFLHDQTARVSTQKPFPVPARGKKAVLMDFGTRHDIIRELSRRSRDFAVVPYNMSVQAILVLHPDGIMLSNGPEDPKGMTGAIKGIRELTKHVPVLGTCLGHQLISLVRGVNTVKLRLGHRGCSHPVLSLSSKKVEIASQNHGYAVEAESLTNTDLIMTHQILSDKSMEGARHKRYPVFGVRYHSETAPGLEDVSYLFDQFTKLMEKENV